MKLRNKKTGEIMDDVQYRNYSLSNGFGFRMNGKEWEYHSLAELNEEWEDYEEPKEWWYIDIHGPHKVTNNDEYYQQVKAASKEIGNYFETEEEAEEVVEKLKAFKRMKDKGFRFKGFCRTVYDLPAIEYDIDVDASRIDSQEYKDLELLFGGEE